MTTQRHPALRGHEPTGPAIALAGPDLEGFTRALVQAYLEFRAGRRSLEQFRPHLSAPLLRRLRRRSSRLLPAPGTQPIVKVMVQRRDQHTFSLVAIVDLDGRRPAITGQLRHDGTRWLVTELTAPEDLERPSGDIRRCTPDERLRTLDDGLDDVGATTTAA